MSLQDQDSEAFRKYFVVVLAGVVMTTGASCDLCRYAAKKQEISEHTGEAKENLGELAKAASTQFHAKGRLCPSASESVPRNASSIKGAPYQSTPADWEVDKVANAGFACLEFSLKNPQRYVYDYKVSGNHFTITARGDLDGDGVLSTFRVEGEVDSSGILTVDPNLTEDQPEE